jgi:hypothetical protein
MVNKFKDKVKEAKEMRMKKEEYDWVDESGKGWRLKKNESLEDLKKRAKSAK